MTTQRLIADLGGTNCRLALVSDTALGQPPERLRRYRNDDFASFTALLRHYLADQGQPKIREIVLAAAGPVADQSVRITNRDWHISAQGLRQEFHQDRVHLFNDLSALGHSLPGLQGADLVQILPSADARTQEQRLVIGIGTGFNISPVIASNTGVICPRAEYGHVALPLDLYQAMVAEIGPRAAPFKTVECCFSGRGLAALFAAFAPDSPPRSGPEIMQAQDDAICTAFLRFYGRLLALLCRNLLKGFLPRGGLFFAGTVARNLLTSPAQSDFLTEFTRPDLQFPEITAPVFCILDDGAALKGCAAFRFLAA
ncbi:glucokinase [Pseudophaeobacter flagellatus]|uniref:glucokinase n=1 Tax=Pseudophaeobacter flagellatus TaxID=2899119 RepID=UPI001E440832|nr:glucokinase [Pseudophaeobacter flagellatus]MCD9146303.1 glucokinase [Pseudophaeobacter flagellatus]